MIQNTRYKILAIVGPTATGKTALAVKIAAQTPSVIISADSRQVYRGMDIVTGKDHPDNIKIHGLDLVDPAEPCSVSVWYDAVMPVIQHSIKVGKLPIVVGGTGLYVRSLTEGIPTLQVPLNPALRAQLEKLTVPELQTRLTVLDPAKSASLNHSDFNNPRRLIRAIEVASSAPILPTNYYPLITKTIGLYYSDSSAYRKLVHSRVLSRLNSGALAETQKLLSTSSPQALTAIGYRSLVHFLRQEISETEMIEDWTNDELAYAKRQLLFFRKLGVIWYDRTKIKVMENIYDILQS